MAPRVSRKTLVRAIVVYLPLLVGVVFTSVGVANFLEVQQGRRAVELPYYGVLPFASRDFLAERMTFEVTSISLEGGYADCQLDVEVGVNWEGEIEFGLQVPGRVENAWFKILQLNDDKTTELYYTGDASVKWISEKGVSILTYGLKPESKNPIYRILASFRWLGVVARRGYTSYEILVPFSNSDSDAILMIRPDAVTIGGELIVSLMVDLPIDSRVVDAVPQPIGETIYWRDESLGHRSLIMEDSVRFGSPHGYPLLQSFRVAFEIPSLRERYDRLVFDSGLFLGVGVQFLIAGIYDAIKLREK